MVYKGVIAYLPKALIQVPSGVHSSLGVNRLVKEEVLRNGRKARSKAECFGVDKNTNVYFSEHLTPLAGIIFSRVFNHKNDNYYSVSDLGKGGQGRVGLF